MRYKGETFTTEEKYKFYDDFINKIKSEYKTFRPEIKDNVKVGVESYTGENLEHITEFISDLLLPGVPPLTHSKRESYNMRCAMYECLIYSFTEESEYYLNTLSDHQIYNLRHLSHPLGCLFDLVNARTYEGSMKYTVAYNSPEGISDMLYNLTIEVDAVSNAAFVLACEAYQYNKYRNKHLAFVYDDTSMYNDGKDIIDYDKIITGIAYAASEISQTCKDLYDYYLSDSGLFLIKRYLNNFRG